MNRHALTGASGSLAISFVFISVHWWLGLAACVCLCGCKSHPLGPYVSPQVEGQVLEAKTGVALSGVRVSRGQSKFDALSGYPKGGQLLMAKVPVQTGSDGRFTLEGERVLSVVRGAGWNEVRLVFSKPGYETLKTNVSMDLANQEESGRPVLKLGPVLLRSGDKQN